MKNLFPVEITKAVSGIDDELRQGIVSFLILNEKATYSTIKKTFAATNGNLNHHLNLLINDSLLTKTLEKEDEKINSYYRLSGYGKQFINSLFYALKPKTPNQLKSFIPQLEKEQKQDIGIIPPTTRLVFTMTHIETIMDINSKLKQTNQSGQLQTISMMDSMLINQ